MVQCPHCSHPMEADFGMTPCPQCKQLVFFDVDGNVMPSEEDSPDPVLNDEPQAELEPEPVSYDEAVEDAVEEVVAESAEETPEEFYAEEAELTEDIEPGPEETVMQGDVDFSSGSEEESFAEESVETETFEEELGEVDEFAGGVQEDGGYAPEDLQELADYGNSELSVGKDGQYLYDLKVSGIDSQDIKKLIEENLTDKRLALNVRGLMKSVKNGVLEIKRINAVKTSILVNRFKSLPVTLQWRQNVITQMDINN